MPKNLNVHVHYKDAASREQMKAALQALRRDITTASSKAASLAGAASTDDRDMAQAAKEVERLLDQARNIIYEVI